MLEILAVRARMLRKEEAFLYTALMQMQFHSATSLQSSDHEPAQKRRSARRCPALCFTEQVSEASRPRSGGDELRRCSMDFGQAR